MNIPCCFVLTRDAILGSAARSRSLLRAGNVEASVSKHSGAQGGQELICSCVMRNAKVSGPSDKSCRWVCCGALGD